MGLIYGAARRGPMGVLAGAAMAARCEVIGVLPDEVKSRELAQKRHLAALPRQYPANEASSVRSGGFSF